MPGRAAVGASHLSMGDGATRPVGTLRDHANALEAALTECLGDPRPKPVHRLRSETRRIEAQLLLLEQLEGLPPFRTEAAKVRKHLKKLRRAAGCVRDLDVQRKLLEKEEGSAAAKNGVRAMVKLRKQRRREAADALLDQVQSRQGKLARAMEALLEVLEPAAHVELAAAELLDLVKKQFRKQQELRAVRPTADQMHTLRKSAKVARYVAESAPGSRRAKQTAKQYESMQQAGGEWHDLLELTAQAKEELGQHHRLVKDFERKRDQHLAQFNELLDPFRRGAGKIPQETR